MAIKDQMKKLRQEKGLTQAELGELMGIHQKQISAYERGRNIPSTDVLIRLAEIFDVSLDYLAFEAEGKPMKVKVQNRELLRRIEEVDKLNDNEQRIILEILDTFILKNRFQKLALGENRSG